MEYIIGRGEKSTTGEIGLTPRAKRVIELAIDEARHIGHNYIGTEHLLLGLLHEGDGVAAGVLDSFGIMDRHALKRPYSQPGCTETARPRTASRTPALDQLSTDLTARPGPENWTRSLAGKKKSNVLSRF